MKVESLKYSDGPLNLSGVLAYEDDGKPRPGVLVVHDGFGLGDHAKSRTQRLAKMGYVALAADLYGGASATTLDAALPLMAEFQGNPEVLRQRATAGLKALGAQAHVDSSRLAAIGFCFGGAAVLELARAGAAGLRGIVSFHGLLTTEKPAQPGGITAKILVLNGADDALVPGEQVSAFQQEMKSAQADWQFVNYGGAKHAFTDPNCERFGLSYLGYSATADRRSWAVMTEFLEEAVG